MEQLKKKSTGSRFSKIPSPSKLQDPQKIPYGKKSSFSSVLFRSFPSSMNYGQEYFVPRGLARSRVIMISDYIIWASWVVMILMALEGEGLQPINNF